MKTFLIKIGKAFNVLERDGIIRGGKRIVAAFFALFRRVGSGDILFITGGVGDSALFRAHHQSEELTLHGFQCSVTVQDNPLLSRYAGRFKIFIFHRTLSTPLLKKLIGEIKKQGKEIIFETDDLVFDPKYLEHMDYFKHMNALERKLYEKGVGGEIIEDPYLKTCTTTTSFLAEKLREYGKQVFISKNKLSIWDIETAEAIINQKKPKEDDKVRIGYLSGTISHNKDFATVQEALLRVMEKFPEVILFLAGPLDVSPAFGSMKERIVRSKFVSRKKHFENISKIDINIAPLEQGNPYCEAKSELKFFEAGILGVPTVATATQTFREAINDGVDGFVASDTEEWTEKLAKLIQDRDLRKKMGEKAREKTLKAYSTKNSYNEEYYAYLRSKL
jgi:O-antigen biosynthesis protein